VPIIGNAINSTWQLGWVFTDDAGKLEWSLASTADNNYYLRDPVPNSPVIGDGTWHHVLAVVDRSQNSAFAYIDGALSAKWTLDSLGTLATGNTITIGEDPTGAYGAAIFDLDDLAIWNRALSSYEAASIYTAGNNGVTFGAAPTPDVTLSIATSGSQVKLTWASGTLQASPTVTGAFTNITTATSPYSVTPSATNLFYRVKVK
jgi:hypothetical protein